MTNRPREWRIEWEGLDPSTNRPAVFQINYPVRPTDEHPLLVCRDEIKFFSSDQEFMVNVLRAKIWHKEILVEIFPFNPTAGACPSTP